MSGAPLFRAVHQGGPVTVGHASPEDLAALPGYPDPGSVRDVLERWSLVAIRFSGDRTEIHALGWRVAERNTWITSPLVAMDMDASMVATRSGHAYRLGTRDGAGVAPGLRSHLAYALRTWGFTDVQS